MTDDKELAITIMTKNLEYIKKVLEAHHLHNCLNKITENEQLFYKLFHKTQEKPNKGNKK